MVYRTDHTGDKDSHGNNNGLMFVVNAALEKGMFYKREVDGLCYGSQFQFSAWYANILKSSACGGSGIPINIRYEIWNSDPGDDESASTVSVGGSACNGAVLLAETNTGNIAATSTLTWRQTSIIFNTPTNQNYVFVVLRNNSPGGCGNDLAIDDITFSPYIPFSIGYTTNLTNYNNTGTITLQATLKSGSIPSGYVFQWQQAPIGTTNWSNVGSVITNFSNATLNLSVGSVGNEIYRLISSAKFTKFQ